MSAENLPTTGSTGTSGHAMEAANTGFVLAAAVFAALGGLLFGYDTGVISGAGIFITKQFGLPHSLKNLWSAWCWWAPQLVRSAAVDLPIASAGAAC
jgi:hypothetical protein